MKLLKQFMLAIAVLAIAAPVFAKGECFVKGKCLSQGQKQISIDYAGYGYDTTVEVVDDGFPINLTQADGKGTYGNSTIAITAEFELVGSLDVCPDTHPIGGWVVPTNNWAVVMTFPSNGQIFGMFNEGWICLDADLITYVGESNGTYVGGSGRFEGAGGEWVSHWEGVNLDPSIGFRSITGDIKGTLTLPGQTQ